MQNCSRSSSVGSGGVGGQKDHGRNVCREEVVQVLMNLGRVGWTVSTVSWINFSRLQWIDVTVICKILIPELRRRSWSSSATPCEATSQRRLCDLMSR
jgi:hypothetical protein